MPSRREKWTERVVRDVLARKTAEERAEKARHKLFRTMFKAQRNGVTYRELHDLTGLSEIRVAQILREEREKDADS